MLDVITFLVIYFRVGRVLLPVYHPNPQSQIKSTKQNFSTVLLEINEINVGTKRWPMAMT